MAIKKAIALSAGLGLRMRPLTLECPKPLLKVQGISMLERVLAHFGAAGVSECVVNTHYKGEMIRQALKDRPGIHFSHETELLETGGGIAKVRDFFGQDLFFAANADIVWTDGDPPALSRLEAAFRADEMDGLLLLHPKDKAFGYSGAGDFALAADGRIERAKPAALVFTGVQLLHPRLFVGHPQGAFSLNILYDRAIAAGRLYGLVHNGGWYHIGTPEALGEIEREGLKEALEESEKIC